MTHAELAELCQQVQKDAWYMAFGYYLIDKLVEYWLGKTDKVQAGSILEVVIKAIKYPFKKRNQQI